MSKEWFLESLVDPRFLILSENFSPMYKRVELLNLTVVVIFFSSIKKHFNLRKVKVASRMELKFGKLQKVNPLMAYLMKQLRELSTTLVMIKDS